MTSCDKFVIKADEVTINSVTLIHSEASCKKFSYSSTGKATESNTHRHTV